MVGVSASVNLSLHHKVQKFSSGTGSPGWSRKKGCKTVVVCGGGFPGSHMLTNSYQVFQRTSMETVEQFLPRDAAMLAWSWES